MARNTRQTDEKRAADANKKASNLDKAITKFMGFADPSYEPIQDIVDRNDRFQKVLNQQNDIIHGISGGSVVDFMQMLQNDPMTRSSQYGNRRVMTDANQMDITRQLKQSSGDLYGYFQDIYSNKFVEMADLEFIRKFIPALGEAVSTTQDAIVASDSLNGTISRTIDFDSSVSETIRNQTMKEIEKIEKDLKLQKKIKNVIVKNTLVSGTYYIYAIPYNDLFENYSRERAEAVATGTGQQFGKITESSTFEDFVSGEDFQVKLDADSVVESLMSGEDPSDKMENKKKYKEFVSSIQEHLSTVKIIDSPVLEDLLLDTRSLDKGAMEASGKQVTVNDPSYVGVYTKYFGKTPITGVNDAGVVNTNKGVEINAEHGFGQTGTYVKYINPRNMIPIKLMDETVGYYYVAVRKSNGGTQNQTMSRNGTPMINTQSVLGSGSNNTIFSTVNLTDAKRTAVVDTIIQAMTQQIVRRFNKKFVIANSNFKKVIADCINYNGYMDNEYHIQFIPAQYVIEFKVNEDENENGVSMLQNSLFPAKLLLSLMVSRLLNYLNKSADKTLVYLAKGPIDVHTGNQVQRVIRNIQETQITFSDLLSTNMVFSKFGRNQNMIIPNSRSGKRLAEFETQEGMQVDMSPEYENKLEQMAILGTGVPSVIMEYIGQSDFAKGFETGNIKFASHIASYQMDFETPLTEFYQKLVENSELSDSVKDAVRNKFEFHFPRPKVLAVSNNSENLGNLQTLMQALISIYYGEDTQSIPKYEQKKTKFMQLAARKYAPYINWDEFDDFFKKANLEVDENKVNQETNRSSGV